MPKKNELVTGKTSKFKSIDTIMKDPASKNLLNSLIDEAIECKTAIQTQQQSIKILREKALDDLGLNPKLFNAYVAASFNNDYQQRKDSLDEQVTLLEFIMGQTGVITNAKTEEDDE